MQSVMQSVSRSVGRSVGQSVGQSVGLSVGRSVSQSVDKSAKYENFKIHNYFIERVRIDLKTFLGLAMPNQCSQTVRKQILS